MPPRWVDAAMGVLLVGGIVGTLLIIGVAVADVLGLCLMRG